MDLEELSCDFEALHSPLLDLDVSDARGALINVVGGSSLTLGEAENVLS